MHDSASEQVEVATFALGGFLGAEASFRGLHGVVSTQAGYLTNRRRQSDILAERDASPVEAIRLTFDTTIVSYSSVLDRFWHAHDPAVAYEASDSSVAAQYRSLILAYSESQSRCALISLDEARLAAQSPISTEILTAAEFTPADAEYQHRLERGGAFAAPANTRAVPGYCGSTMKEWSPFAYARFVEFGTVFDFSNVAGRLHLFLLRNDAFLETTAKALGDWIDKTGADPGQPGGDFASSGFDDSTITTNSTVVRSVATADLSSASTIFEAMRVGSSFVFITTLSPGDFMTRPGVEINLAYAKLAEGGEHPVREGTCPVSEPAIDRTKRVPRGPGRVGVDSAEDVWFAHISPATFTCPGEMPVHWSYGGAHQAIDPSDGEREHTLSALGSRSGHEAVIVNVMDPIWISTDCHAFGRTEREIEEHSVEGIRDCFAHGVSPNALFKDRPLIDELISEYMRSPQFKDCVRAFVEHGLDFDDSLLLAVLLDDASGLDHQLGADPGATSRRYTLRCAFTPLHEVTLLHICAEFNHLACAKVLVRHGADINAAAGTDEHGFGGQTPIFHTVNQILNASADMLHYLLSESADLEVTVPGLIWGRGHPWETLLPAVNPISYAMMGLLPQMHRDESVISTVISVLLEARYAIEYSSPNVPNSYLAT